MDAAIGIRSPTGIWPLAMRKNISPSDHRLATVAAVGNFEGKLARFLDAFA